MSEAVPPTPDEELASLRREREVLLRLQRVAREVGAELDLGRLLERILDEAITLTEAERGFLLLLDPDGVGWSVKAARNFDGEEVRRPSAKISRGVLSKILETGEPLIAADAGEDERFVDSESVAEQRLKSVLCLPLLYRGQKLGALYLDNRHRRSLFGPRDGKLLQSFADQAAIAIANAGLHAAVLERERLLAAKAAELARANEQLAERAERQEADIGRLTLENKELESALGRRFPEIVSRRQGRMREAIALLDKVAESTVPVLILGESGTGKELFARAIHANGPLAKAPFVSLNCAALSETLLESELFGHMRGSFTGADRDRKGLFEMAHHGTLFLDEVGEMSEGMQKKLLRALQEGEVRPVGGKDVVKVKVRVIAATNRDLRERTREGAFREDLYYRLAVVTIPIPPLRDRREDVPLLVSKLMERLSAEAGRPPREVPPAVMRALERYDWPGNVRELENEVRRLVALGGEVLTEEDLSPAVRERRAAAPSGGSLEEVELAHIRRTLVASGGNLTEAARLLGIDYSTLYRKMKRHGLKRE